MSNSYLFYDLETSGLNKCFDQVLQFAAIRTDLDLNEIERHEIFIKLNPDVIPSPGAILVHGISLERLQDGVCEYEGIKKIHGLFNTPGTITIGYNTLGFDDEFLRFSFYRNLFAPYTHQYANNCRRMDLYPMAVLYYLFKHDGIVWPKIDGVSTLKLENLGRANGLLEGNAHNAMNDVITTLKFARLLKKEEKMWDYLCGSFNKKVDMERLKKLSSPLDDYQRALLIEGNLGAARFYQNSVIGLGLHNHYKNQSLWLPVDSFPLYEVSRDNVCAKTFVNRKRFGEPPILLPFNENYGRYLSEDRLKLMEENINWIRKNQSLFLDIVEFHKDYKYPEILNLDVDAALYQVGFKSDQDQQECLEFQNASLQEKVDFVESFSNPNSRSQVVRILGRNYPDLLAKNSSLYNEFQYYLRKVKEESMVNYKNDLRLSPRSALIEMEAIRQARELSDREKNLLDELSRYIQSL